MGILGAFDHRTRQRMQMDHSPESAFFDPFGRLSAAVSRADPDPRGSRRRRQRAKTKRALKAAGWTAAEVAAELAALEAVRT